MGELMKKLGIGFMKRQAAKTVGYGVGKQQQVRRSRGCSSSVQLGNIQEPPEAITSTVVGTE